MWNYTLKRGSTWPPLTVRVGLNRVGNLTGCSAILRVKDQAGNNISEYTASITDATTGVVEYQFLSGQTDTAGVYWLEFWITLASGDMVKVPDDSFINFIISDDIA